MRALVPDEERVLQVPLREAGAENCDIDTGGLAVGLRVSNVAIARDNNLGSVTVDASAELRAKDNAYGPLTNNGTLDPLAGDRAVYDALDNQARHANDIDEATGIHHTLGTSSDQAAPGDHTHDHDNLTNVTANQHHNQSHILGSGGDHSDAPADQADGFVKRNAANDDWEEVPYGTTANTVAEGDHSHAGMGSVTSVVFADDEVIHFGGFGKFTIAQVKHFADD